MLSREAVQRGGPHDTPLAILLGILTMVAIVPLLVLSGAWSSHSAERIRSAEVEALRDIARSSALDVAREFNNLVVYAKGMAANPALADEDLPRLETALRRAAAETGHHFILTTSELKQLINTMDPAGGPSLATRTSEEIRVVSSTRAPYVTDLRRNRFTGELMFGVRIAVTVGARDYVMTVLPPQSTAVNVLREIYLRPGWSAKLVDGQGRIVARSTADPHTDERLDLGILRDRMAMSPDGVVDGATIEGVPAVISFHAVPGSNWKAIVWAPNAVLDVQKRSWQQLVAATSLVALATGLGLAFAVSHAIRRPTSSLVRAAEAIGDGRRVEPIRSVMREANVIGQALELAARRIHERERHLRLVMRELSHRSKNLLAIIQAMARQSAHSSPDFNSFAHSFDERLRALARSQDMLVATDWEGGDLAGLAHEQVAPFLRDASALSVEGPTVFISPAAVQNLGMAFHELATNAAKHGALSSQLGRVDIYWRVEDGSRLRIVWRESGGPEVRRGNRRGFGRIVLEKVAPSALNGEAELGWTPDGLTWTFTGPLDVVAGTGKQDFGAAQAEAPDTRSRTH